MEIDFDSLEKGLVKMPKIFKRILKRLLSKLDLTQIIV